MIDFNCDFLKLRHVSFITGRDYEDVFLDVIT